MKRVLSVKTAILLPLALLSAVAAVPASANWFSADPATGLRRHIGSAPNPRAEDMRMDRAQRANDQVKDGGGAVQANGVTSEKSG